MGMGNRVADVIREMSNNRDLRKGLEERGLTAARAMALLRAKSGRHQLKARRDLARIRSKMVAQRLGPAALGETAATQGAAGDRARVITRAELEKVPLTSVMDPPAASGSLVFADAKTAVWLEGNEFVEGQAVPAWLAIKSLARQPERGFAA